MPRRQLTGGARRADSIVCGVGPLETREGSLDQLVRGLPRRPDMAVLRARLGEEWRTRAEHYSQLVEERQFDDQVHDLGFVLCPTWGNGGS